MQAALRNHTDLIIRSETQEEPPAWLGKLVHLEMLCLRYPRMRSLPTYLTCLTELRMLHLVNGFDIWNRDRLNDLPSWISSLTSLQHIDSSYCESLTELPPGMSSLTSLQHIDFRIASR